MTGAAAAMAQAVTSLDDSKTAEALPPEMEALNRLLKAQAEVKRRDVQRQQAGSGSGGNRSNYDVSALFDQELQKAQQTNYETKSTSAEDKGDSGQSALDAIKELARRQDELLKRQQELARARAQMTEEALKRELEKLTREQSELRQQAEELAQKMASQNPPPSGSPQSASRQDQKAGQKGQQGQQAQQGQPGQSGQSGPSGQGGQSAQTGDSRRMRDVSEEMRNAASELRRQDPGQASARGNRALEKLRELQQQLESARPEDRRRALGDLQLEARQLADAQRQIASELARTQPGDAGKDAVRKLAGEQDRLAARASKLQDALKQQAAVKGSPARSTNAADARGASAPASGQTAGRCRRRRQGHRASATLGADATSGRRDARRHRGSKGRTG